jgi:hypothetical protein
MLLIAVFVLSSCSKSSQKNAKFIPDNAAVISIDVKQIIEKSKIADNADAKKKLQATMEEGVKNQETKNLIKKIMEDPTKAGIDLTEPIFVFFADNNDKQAAVATISSKDDFLELANALQKEDGGEPVKEKDGIQYIQDGKAVVAFDDAAFFISESYSLDDVIAKFKNDDTKGTMAENDDFAKLAEAKGFIKALIPMAIAEGVMDADAKKMLPEGAELKDLSIILNLTTDKGEAKLSFETIAKSDAWKNYIKESTEMCGKIAGDYLKYLPKGAFMAYANINGKKMFELFDKKGIFDQGGIKDIKDEVKKVLEAIEGDFALSIGNVNVDKSAVINLPGVVAYLKTKDASITDKVKEQGINPDEDMDFGFKNGATYFVVGEDAAFTEAKSGFDKSVINGRRVYIFCDIASIAKVADLINADAKDAASAASEYIKTAEFYDTSDTAGELIVKMSDAEKDPIENIVNLIVKQF